MRQTRQVVRGKVPSSPSAMQRTVYFIAFLMPLLVLAQSAFAGSNSSGDLQGYATAVGEKTNSIVDVINYIAYASGAILMALGLGDLKKHAENPSQAQLKLGLTKLFFGGLFLGLPFIASVIAQTMGGYMDPLSLFKWDSFKFQGGGVNSGSISGIIAKGINNATVFFGVSAFAAFVIGVFFSFRGLQMLRAHIDNPGNAPLAEALKRLAVGGALLSFPVIAKVVKTTFGASGDAISNSGWSSTSGGGGLDGMMVAFVKDISNPAYVGIEIFCYISGVLMVLFALQRLVKTAQDGPRGPLGFGTITMFIVAGCLLSFPQFLGSVGTSLFGNSAAATNVDFMALSGSVDGAQLQNARNVFSAVLAFMAVIGFLSVVRGLFILKAFADGNGQATMMSVCTHIVAGALAVNLGGFINAVQKSLGVTTFPVTFE